VPATLLAVQRFASLLTTFNSPACRPAWPECCDDDDPQGVLGGWLWDVRLSVVCCVSVVRSRVCQPDSLMLRLWHFVLTE
jgi:hypothetical protein